MIAILVAAAIAVGAQPAPQVQDEAPVECIYARLERPYLAELWRRLDDAGIPVDDPLLTAFEDARAACAMRHRWTDEHMTLAGFYAMSRAGSEAALAANFAPGDQAALGRLIRRYVAERFETARQLFGAEDDSAMLLARADFRAFFEQAEPALFRRLDFEDVWSAAMPGVSAEFLRANFALQEVIG